MILNVPKKGLFTSMRLIRSPRKSEKNIHYSRDVSGEGVQQALLKILEGTVASVPPQASGTKHPHIKEPDSNQ